MVGTIMMFLGKGTIMGLSCYLTFLLVQASAPNVSQPLLPAAIILLISYIVGSMFLSIFSFSATAILHCFILDEDTGGQSGMTPKSLEPFLANYDSGFKKVEGEGAESNTQKDGGKPNNME